MKDVGNMSACQIQTAPPRLPVEMKNVSIPVNVPAMPTVLREIIEEYVLAFPTTLAIHME